MNNTRYYCTYFDKNYLVRALSLIESLATHEENDHVIFCVCMDEISRTILQTLKLNNVTTIPLHQIEDRDYELLASREGRSLVEYYWTTTATIILRILERNPEIDVLTYVDADLFFFSSPDPVYEELDGHSVLIHEHRYSPSLAHLEPSYGRFNVGLLSFKRDENAFATLKRWRGQCIEWCYNRVEENRMGDQKYLDEWPTRFQGIKVSGHPGVGLAPWNYDQYEYGRDTNGDLTVNGKPVVFFHYSSMSIVNENLFIPRRHKSYALNLDLAKNVYVPYCGALQTSISKINHILPGFKFGLSGDENPDQHSFLFHASKKNELEKKHSINSIAVTPDWHYCGEKMQDQPTHEIPQELALRPGQSLLNFLENPFIADRIEMIYFAGCHLFEEQPWFEKTFSNLKSLFLFEPIPQVVQALSARTAGNPKIKVLPYAVSDESGVAEFNIANNLYSSSLLPLGEHKNLFPWVDYQDRITVKKVTLSQTIEATGGQVPDMLYIDVQGAEYQVLRGLTANQLQQIKAIYTEVSTTEVYMGAKLLDDVVEYLAPYFHFIGFCDMADSKVHGDALFVNRAFLASLEPAATRIDERRPARINDFSNIQGDLAKIEDLCNNGNTTSALEAVDRLIVKVPSLPELRNIRAELAYRLASEAIEQSIATWKELAKDHPGNPLYLTNLGVAQWNTNQRGQALKSLTTVLSQDPKNDTALENLNEITNTLTNEADSIPIHLTGISSLTANVV